MSPKVLVVEDEADIRLTFRIILQTAGYLVVEASTGEDALSTIGSMVPDAIILDLQLPGIDGWQVLTTMRQEGLAPSTPVIIASANDDPNLRARANEFGCFEVFAKPFSAEGLRDTLARVLSFTSPDGTTNSAESWTAAARVGP
jgi:two-component system KDP operon response regulator KdpE